MLTLPPPPASRGSVQLGFSFTDDFAGNSGYSITARHQLLPVNRLGGEWENVVQLGTVGLLDSRFYQPLEAGMKWFVEPGVGFLRELADIWVDGTPVLEYEIESLEARLGAGRVLGRWGELRATAYTADFRATLRIGPPILPSDNERRGGVRLGFRIDTVDDVVFATRGTEASISFDRSLSAFGADSETDLVHGWIEHSFSFGGHYDPTNTGHGLLLVNNDDVVRGGDGRRRERDGDRWRARLRDVDSGEELFRRLRAVPGYGDEKSKIFVAILATNLRANLDEAFTRRLQFIINFPFPDEAYRLKIWEVLMPVASGALLAYGGWRVIQGQLSLGDLVMFEPYFERRKAIRTNG